MTTESKVVQEEVKNLHFDHDNPRLSEYGITAEITEDEILDILWDAMDVRELVQSIAASGFFPHEALIVAEENGKKLSLKATGGLLPLRLCLRKIKMADADGLFRP